MVMVGFLMPAISYAQGEAAPETMTGLNVGETIPEFTLKDQDGNDQSLKSLLAKEGTTVLVFYRSANW
jgi:cytochrome oxidase Cu insertion factor (SCO1/SenC/PrrC family)